MSEQVVVDFDNPANTATVSVANLYKNEGGSGAHEYGHWDVYSNGVKVGEGDFIATEGSNQTTFTIELPEGATFDQLVLSANPYFGTDQTSGDSSDYWITGIDYSWGSGGDGTGTGEGEGSDDTLYGGEGDDVLSGNQGDDILVGGADNDTMDGGAGIDQVDGDVGDDRGVFVLGEGGTGEFYDGGEGTDTLVVRYTEADLADPAVVAALRGLQQFIADNADPSTDSGEIGDFESVLGLKVQDWEEIELDGPELPDYEHDLDIEDAAGDEDTAIPLDIDIDLDGESGASLTSVTISNIPTGATLSAGTLNDDGSVTLTPAELEGLTITPAADSDANFDLTVTSASTGPSGDQEDVDTLSVVVRAVADKPTVEAEDVTGAEDSAIALDIDGQLSDLDGSEGLSFIISGLPEGAELSAGTVNEEDGSVTLTQAELAGLTVTPPEDFSGSFDLSVKAIATEAAEGDEVTTKTAEDIEDFTVTVTPVLDDPELKVDGDDGNADGKAETLEDTAVGLKITVEFGDESETLDSVVISDIPAGAVLSAGTVNDDGSVTLTSEQLNGLTITPPADSGDDFDLSITAHVSDGDVTDTITATLPVIVHAVADDPTLTAASEVTLNTANAGDDTLTGTSDADEIYGGGGDDTITGLGGDDVLYGDVTNGTVEASLNINAAVTDTDGSESLADFTISGVPEGVTLSAGEETSPGVWTVSADDISSLSLTTPADQESFDLKVSTNSIDTDADDDVTDTSDAVEQTITINVADAIAGDDSITGGAGNDEIHGNDGDDTLIGDGPGSESEETEVMSVTYNGGSAGYHNSFGYFFMDENGQPTTGTVVWNDVKDIDQGTEFDIPLDGVSSDQVGYFILPNGGNKNSDEILQDGAEVTFVANDAGGFDAVLTTGGGESITLATQNNAVYFSGDGSLNPDGKVHVQIDGEEYGFEDLPIPSGDGDFNDVIFNIAQETIVTGSTEGNNDSLYGGEGDDVLSGNQGDDILVGGADNDTMDGGAGIDQVDGDVGDDRGVFVLGEGGTGEFYDGGEGTDTLVVRYTEADLADPAVVAALRGLQQFIADNADPSTDSGEIGDFESVLGLKVQDWEEIEFDGPDLPDYEHKLVLGEAEGNEDEAIALDIDVDFGGEVGATLLSVTLSNIPEGAVLKSGETVLDTASGEITLGADQLEDLTIQAPADSGNDFTLTLSALTDGPSGEKTVDK